MAQGWRCFRCGAFSDDNNCPESESHRYFIVPLYAVRDDVSTAAYADEAATFVAHHYAKRADR